MQNTQLIGHYTDRQYPAALARTDVRISAQLARVADHLCENAEELIFLVPNPTINNCRIAGMMLGLAYNLLMLGFETTFEV